MQTILRWIRWIIGVALAILVIGFAIANRQRVLISFNPLSPGGTFSSLEMPLWLLFFFGILVGIFAGWIACWLAQTKHRKRAREASTELARLNIQHAELLRRADNGQATSQQIVPVEPVTGWI